MSPGARRPHQVRTYLEAELYERVLREAAVQRQSVSECIHDALEELYAIRDELSRPLEMSTAAGSGAGPLAHRLINALEERLLGAFSRQLEEIQELGTQIRRLDVMVDRQQVSLMLYLPDISREEEQARIPSTTRRYNAWREAVDKILAGRRRRTSAHRPEPAPESD
jgi:hypothetical protein